MCTAVCQRWIKHATIINNCYPTNPEEKSPKSSELSRLVWYAKSRPAKLTKCGVYLEKRISGDVAKRRKQDLGISLEIIKTLIRECNEGLNMFSKNVIKIIIATLNTEDIDLAGHAASAFIIFCAHHDGSTLGVDNEFTQNYEELIKQFAMYAARQSNDKDIEMRYRSIGLHALQAVTTSSASYSKTQLESIVPAILYNLTDSSIGLEALQKHDSLDEEAVPNQRLSITIEAISAEANARLAYHCLKQLFNPSKLTHVEWSVQPVFVFLDKNEMWWPKSFGITLVLCILSMLPPQDRYTLVSVIKGQLEYTPEFTPQKATLVQMLSSILTSPLTLAGLPILEVLDCLLHLVLKLRKVENFMDEKASLKEEIKQENMGNMEEVENEREDQLEKITLQELYKSIGGLATHIYYNNQITDIIHHIVKYLRLEQSTLPSSDIDNSITEGTPTPEQRKTLLRCLSLVVQKNQLESPPVEVPVEVFQDSLQLCLDTDVRVRRAYASVLVTFLNGEISKNLRDSAQECLKHLSKDTIQFLNMIHVSLYQYALMDNAEASDYIALLDILKALLVRFRGEQLVRAVPFLFKLQADATELKVDDVRQRALASGILRYFQEVAIMFDLPDLQTYLEKIQDERLSKNQWSLDINPRTLTTPTIDESALTPVDLWLDRSAIVSQLVNLKDLNEIVGSNLSEKLMTEWTPEGGFENIKREVFRIQVADPQKLTSIMVMDNGSGELQKIDKKVTDFQYALDIGQTNDSSEHGTSVTSDMESVTTVQLSSGLGGTKRKIKEKLRNEVAAFLNTIDRASTRQKIIDPPYPTK
ncbi:2565_t:CDS:10 [Paraglomus brasilianum]|uniref:2565_t:CDS:1 n=1 Tax=Paraglomus brasilianum TaxID=144538 RepID=A0A9N8ZCV2_9GLOM|nr:2565_t:CDS:10 [Paraglomus brasilianum]